MDKLPKGWRTFDLDDLKVKSEVGLVRNASNQNSIGNFKYIKMNNITMNGTLYLDKIVYVEASNNEIKRYSLIKNDFLFNTRNSKELVGKTCLFELEEKNVLYNNNILRIQFRDSVNPKFINYQFKSASVQTQLESIKSGTTNVCAIYYKNLKFIKIALPPLSEQTRIVSMLDALFARIDQSIALLEENIKHTKGLMASVLEELFHSSVKQISLSEIIVKTVNINPLLEPETKFTYIDITSVNNQLHQIENPKILQGKDAPSRAKKSVIVGDIVFATTRPNLKNIALVSNNYSNPVASTGFCVLRPKKGISNEFLFLCLLSNNIQEQINPFIILLYQIEKLRHFILLYC